MLKVILIDDEPLVTEGLIEMIDWHKYGFKVSGVANEGLTGFNLIKEIEPDLVITDIRMPEMDGLTLIQRCQETLEKEICFLVFSGYSDFDYIKTAMDLKSLSYILKPIDTDEIHKELVRIQGLFELAERKTQRMKENIRLITKMNLKRIIEEPYKKAVVERVKLLLDFKAIYFYAYVKFISIEKISTSPLELLKVIQKQFLTQHITLHIIDTLDNEFDFLVCGLESEMEFFFAMLKKTFEEGSLFDTSWFWSKSNISSDIEQLKRLSIEVHQNLRNVFYENEKYGYIEYDEHRKFSKDVSIFNYMELANKVVELESVELKHYVVCMLRKVRVERLDPDILRINWESLLDLMYESYQQIFSMNQYKTYSQFKSICLDMILFYKNQVHLSALSDIIYQIKKYVEQHFSEDVRLKSIAGQFGYNCVYLGQLFLKEEGQKYNDYVLSYRLDKAKELLRYTDKSIKEIAIYIGFNNPDYFVQKFKEIEGISPTRYCL